MKKKEHPLKENLNVKKMPIIPDTPSSFKKTECELSNPNIKQNVPTKIFSPMAIVKGKIDTIIGGIQTDSKKLKKFHDFKDQALKQSQNDLAKIKEHRNTKLMSLDNESLSRRIYELEDHLIELHSAFDDFVLKSDQFLNYEQFVELRKDSEERIRTLDNLQKSIEESKNQILKDTSYMDDIIEAFAHVKKKIELLEKKTDDISKKIGSGANQANFMDKLLGKPVVQNMGGSESVTLARLKKDIAELHSQMENMKKSEDMVRKEVDELKGKLRLTDQKSNDAPHENPDKLKEQIDILERRIDDDGKLKNNGEIAELKKKLSEISANVAEIKKIDVDEKIRSETVAIKKEMDKHFETIKKTEEEIEKKMKAINKKNGTGQPNFFGKLLGNTETSPADNGGTVKLAAINKQISELQNQFENMKKSEEKTNIGTESINLLKRQMNEISMKLDKMNNNRPNKENIEEDIIKRIDIGTKLNKAVNEAKNEMKSNVDSRIDALQVQSNVIYRADLEKFVHDFNKSHDELKEEVSSLKSDLENQASKFADSKREHNESVKNLMAEIRKEMNGKMPREGKIVREKDISDIRTNIEKLKAISQEL
ncbi:MAG: hypothetical protein ABIG84_01335 [archaeon]